MANDAVMVHAGIRSIGRILGGPDSLIAAILDVIGPIGTLLVYTDWNADYHDLINEEEAIPESLRADIAPFEASASRATRDNGAIAEFIRTYPGAFRSANPGASCAAIGGRAEWFIVRAMRRVSGPNAAASSDDKSTNASTCRNGFRTNHPLTRTGSKMCSSRHSSSRSAAHVVHLGTGSTFKTRP